MCYDIRYLTKKKLQYARRFAASEEDIQELEEQLHKIGERTGPYYHISGFDHPDVPVITNENRRHIRLYNWGLIPRWVKDVNQAVTLSNKTLNARGEEMFEKPAYRSAARHRRCLVMVDGFYEHHWKNNKAYPYHITLKNKEPIALGGLWETWEEKQSGLIRQTFTIVTTRANAFMARIHNKPRGSAGPRMPLIIPKELEGEWLRPVEDQIDIQCIKEMVEPYDQNELEAHTVARLKGKSAVGNIPAAVEKVSYEELENDQGQLF